LTLRVCKSSFVENEEGLSMEGEMLKGHLDMIVLAALAVGPAHGYAVIEEIRRRSGEAINLPEGTIYPALHRLQQVGLLSSKWVTAESGRRRRVYALTPSGRRALAQRRAVWQQFSSAIRGLLDGKRPSSKPA
jgi:PadR family transcriptional regulator, regulatory protein PadR